MVELHTSESAKFLLNRDASLSVVDSPIDGHEEKAEPTIEQPVIEEDTMNVGCSKTDDQEMLCGPHVKTIEDLTGLPAFPADTKSLLSKHLSTEIWRELKDASDK